MGVYRFEDLRVWQAATVSVMFNINEGFFGRLDSETGQFLRYAAASNGELKAGYYAAAGREYLTARELEHCVQANESIVRMLRRWQATRTEDQGRTHDQGRTQDQAPRTKDRS